jgi:hypothetical protein
MILTIVANGVRNEFQADILMYVSPIQMQSLRLHCAQEDLSSMLSKMDLA